MTKRKMVNYQRLATSEKSNLGSGSNSSRRNAGSSEMTSQKKCILVTGILVTITFLAGYAYNTMGEHVYAIVIDAGSTGTRLNAFNFKKSLLTGTYELSNDLFVEIKPGLSSFADDPKKGAATILELLSHSKLQHVIPPSEWANTPLALKATAGLRLLPEKQANAILDEVRSVLSDLPFFTNENSVSIMEGVDEGIFSWFTINFLSNSLGGSVKDTAAAIDMGGGSTQITFAAEASSPLWQTSKNFLHPVTAFHQNLTVYTHSYLGMGLMAARMAILSVGNKEGSTTLKSACMHPIMKKPWTYNRVTYTVQGLDNAEGMSHIKESVCQDLVRSYIKGKIDKPEELKHHSKINTISYFFDRATEFGLIDPFEGGRVQVKSFKEAATYSCRNPNADQPFMCLDMLFIHTLLTDDGFGLKENSYLDLYKKIDNHELSWALGAAFHILQNGV
ncbi:ectonucleoside triphosphate diphosphohydrolase 5 isoform X1 [Frankliniella occidentalis]|uniref:Ectonucleoside triphosphate diphosphohydrolase 5 isoform X1 n=1 Tax=Frankliniella occidentalis TaxID=133901 RepID=A0A6J1S756_FRAOC|nr:ectonucleoside triphosphate diphosphohydrolase 5 isoform X1 [Frankliniella occidentalis]